MPGSGGRKRMATENETHCTCYCRECGKEIGEGRVEHGYIAPWNIDGIKIVFTPNGTEFRCPHCNCLEGFDKSVSAPEQALNG